MYWSRALRLPAITEKFTHDRFFRFFLKVLIDEDVPQDIRESDKFWKAFSESHSERLHVSSKTAMRFHR
ncbi:unnamed protein product [Knipowitschia caucasica]